MGTFDHDTFLSPFTWRYGSEAMRRLWSERERRRAWRRTWVALAQAQQACTLLTAEQVDDLAAHVDDVDLERAHAIEAEIRHDLMAELRTFAGQCPAGGRVLHLGATSMDIEDNADVLRQRAALDLVRERLAALLGELAGQIERHAGLECMAFTHLQPAEPTTVGYRLAGYAQDLLADYAETQRLREGLRGKGFKGAVGTGASYADLLADTGKAPEEMERLAMSALGLAAFPVANQVYPRRQDWTVLNALASIAMTIHRLAFDLRILQSPPIGEWAEPFGKSQVGSSAMPFKRNPIDSENMDSLARYLAALPRVAWDNAANNLLERTLDDSANRRLILPEAFLAVDELLLRCRRVVEGLRVNERAIQSQLDRYAPFAASERVLLAAAKAGGDRQALHELLREHSLAAWDAIQQGEPNPLRDRLAADPELVRWLPAGEIGRLMQPGSYTGDAEGRARALASEVRRAL